MSKPSKIMKLMTNIKPTRMWIDGKCFDIPKIQNKINIETNLEEDKSSYNINFSDDTYKTSFRLPGIYYEKLYDFYEFSIGDLQKETETDINVPEDGSDDCLVVSGKSLANVIDATRKLHSVLSLIREDQRVLQFLSVPLNSENIKAKFANFKMEILKHGEGIAKMHESLFQKPERLHLTLGVLSLFDDIETAEAIKVLNECKEKIIDPVVAKNGPLKIKIQGLECMNDNISKVNVLYAKASIRVGDEDIMQNLTNSITDSFNQKGLIRQYLGNVKLHMTLINTKYRKVEGRKRKWKMRRQPFDAKKIMKEYKDYDFGECDFDQLHLSWISQIEENGYYKAMSLVNF